MKREEQLFILRNEEVKEGTNNRSIRRCDIIVIEVRTKVKEYRTIISECLILNKRCTA